jgi:nucleoside-diphosphate-sugar epimerase
MGVTFITGSEGFVGSAGTRALAGYKVRPLVRRSSPRTSLDIAGLEVIEGDTNIGEPTPAGARLHLQALVRARTGEQFLLPKM